MHAPDGLRPQEMTKLADLIRPVDAEQQRDRQLVRRRAGHSGKGGGRKQFEQTLWTLAELGLLDAGVARDLLGSGRSSEDLVADYRATSKFTEADHEEVLRLRIAHRIAREEQEAAGQGSQTAA